MLVICIWILAFFSVLSVGLYGIISSQIRLARRLEENFLCGHLAKSAFLYAKEKIVKDETAYDTLYKLRQEQERELGIGKFIYTLSDEESKININNASEEVISKLPGLSSELAESIISSSLRPFQAKGEILAVEGITQEAFDECKGFITVHGEGKININTASIQALQAIGLDENIVATIDDFRKGPDGEEAGKDDGVFENTDEIIAKLNSFRSLSEAELAQLTNLISQGSFTVAGENYSLQIEAQVLGRPAMKYVIVIDTGEDKIKEWREF